MGRDISEIDEIVIDISPEGEIILGLDAYTDLLDLTRQGGESDAQSARAKNPRGLRRGQKALLVAVSKLKSAAKSDPTIAAKTLLEAAAWPHECGDPPTSVALGAAMIRRAKASLKASLVRARALAER